MGCGAVATSSDRAGALRVLACAGRALAAGRAGTLGCGAVATSSGRAGALRVLVCVGRALAAGRAGVLA